jgi:hypothetical protein
LRLGGDEADNILFFYEGFSERAKLTGTRTRYV